MKKKEFTEIILEELGEEDTSLDPSTKLKSLEMWDSMSTLVIISLVDEYFGKSFKSEDIQAFNTFQDIINAIGEEKFD